MVTGSRAVLFLGTIAVLMLCIFMLIHSYRVDIFPDISVKDYQPMKSFLISKRLSIKKSFSNQYRADFLISYNVNGVQYNRWVSGNGLDMSYDANRAKQENVLSRFSIGGTYPSWYNPNNPQSAVLVLRDNWSSILFMIIPALLGVFAFYAIINDLLWFFVSALGWIRRVHPTQL